MKIDGWNAFKCRPQRVSIRVPKQRRVHERSLDAVNEMHAERNQTLHPTKGFRTISPVSTEAGRITDLIRQGVHGFDTLTIRKKLEAARRA